MSNRPVFIHSLFRTGSTYIWNKFRQNKQNYCYYEPFHEVLGDITLENPSPWFCDNSATDELRHPRVERNYLYEYEKLLRPNMKGVPFYKKSFGFDDFCNNNHNTPQKTYIDFLIKNCEDKTPVFQFNRSSLRIQWFKRNYPDSLNIYIVRNPRDQFQSYLLMKEENKLNVFLAMDIQILALNLDSKYFRPLAGRIPLFRYQSQNIKDERLIYSHLLQLYNIHEQYNIFYFLWFSALIENILHADFLLDINLLCSESNYQYQVLERLKSNNIDNIDFGDAKIRMYEKYILPKKVIEEIEANSKTLVIKNRSLKDIESLDKKLDHNLRDRFNLNQTQLMALKQRPIQKNSFNEDQIRRYNEGFNLISNELVREKDLNQRSEEISRLKLELAQKNRQLLQKEDYIRKIYNGKSYRVGRFFLYPFIFFKKKSKV